MICVIYVNMNCYSDDVYDAQVGYQTYVETSPLYKFYYILFDNYQIRMEACVFVTFAYHSCIICIIYVNIDCYSNAVYVAQGGYPSYVETSPLCRFYGMLYDDYQK